MPYTAYTASTPPTCLITTLPTMTAHQQYQLDQALRPGKRVTLTHAKRDYVTIGGAEHSNPHPQQIPNSTSQGVRSSLSQGPPTADLYTAINLMSASPTRRASYSSSPNRPSPLQLCSEETVHVLPRLADLASIPMVRKKSGVIVKSSLKRGKSAPTTPTYSKNVHFDAQLEHVRLFLQAETPDAVKKDAEPLDLVVDDELTLVRPNWPTQSVISSARMIHVESIVFSDDKIALNGRIHVQNVAFHKDVTVRYTFDYWRTVHESHAAYQDSVKDKQLSLDRFTFQISLAGKVGKGLAPEDEQTTMYFAVRYRVEGREYWDNNSGMNYHVEFKRTAHKLKVAAAPSWSETKPAAKDQQKSEILSSSPLSSSPSNETLPLKKQNQTNRYDIGLALSATKKVTASPASVKSVRGAQNWPPRHPGVTTASSIVGNYANSYGLADQCLPTTITEPLTWDAMRDFSYGASRTHPITIPKANRAMPEPTGYFDLVNKYCFYGGNSSPYSSSPYSNSPPAAVIHG